MVSRSVTSNQQGVHEGLEALVRKHLSTEWMRPVRKEAWIAWQELCQGPLAGVSSLILDSGCGTGISTYRLALANPQSIILGVDKSFHRLKRGRNFLQGVDVPANLCYLQADLLDFWVLLAESGIQVEQHYLFYPNPWPKKHHLGRRWHGHPVFPLLGQLSLNLELRTNWAVYAQEFGIAWRLLAQVCGHQANGQTELFSPSATKFVSPFEEKYVCSGQVIWRFLAKKAD